MPPSFGLGDRFVVRADVFNLLNSTAVLQRYAQHETAKLNPTVAVPNAQYIPDPLYLSPIAYQTPRYVRLGFDVSF